MLSFVIFEFVEWLEWMAQSVLNDLIKDIFEPIYDSLKPQGDDMFIFSRHIIFSFICFLFSSVFSRHTWRTSPIFRLCKPLSARFVFESLILSFLSEQFIFCMTFHFDNAGWTRQVSAAASSGWQCRAADDHLPEHGRGREHGRLGRRLLQARQPVLHLHME